MVYRERKRNKIGVNCLVYCLMSISNAKFIKTFELLQIRQICPLSYRSLSKFPHAVTILNYISSYNFSLLWTSMTYSIFCIVYFVIFSHRSTENEISRISYVQFFISSFTCFYWFHRTARRLEMRSSFVSCR